MQDTFDPKPDTPPIGNPPQFVKVPDCGVPNTGDSSVGLVPNTNFPEPVSSVTAAARLDEFGVAKNVDTFDARPEIPPMGNPLQFVKVPDCGVPNTGDSNVGPEPNTNAPEPVPQ